jgi:hypothetical protein
MDGWNEKKEGPDSAGVDPSRFPVTRLPSRTLKKGEAFTGHRICCVIGHLKYDKYVCVPEALHLRHPVNAYRISISHT